MDDLKKQTARGSLITGGITMALRPMNIIASFLLLRLLNPEDFGTVALALLLLNTSNLFTGLGMGSAIIHTSEDRKKASFHAFVMMMAFSFVLFAVVFLNAAAFARLLGSSDIVPILQWLSLLIVINTSSTIPTSLLRKDMKFGRVGASNLISQVVYTILAIGFAFAGYGVWSLVIAQLGSSLAKVAASWYLCPGWDWIIPQRWDGRIARSLLGYGGQNMWSGLLSYAHTHWDDWLVGRYLGDAALGFYSKAYDLTNNTIKQLTDNVIGTVFFPSYTKIQDDKARLTRAYLKSVRLVLLIVVPLSLGVLAIAPEAVRVLWGAKWVPMIPVLQIYAFMLLTRPISTNTAPLFLAVGKPNYNSRAGYVLLAVMVPLALWQLQNGIFGVATAVVVSHVVGAIYNVYQVNTILPGSAVKTMKAIFPALLSGVIMMAAVWLAKVPVVSWLGGNYGFPGLFILVALGGLIYIPAIYLTQRDLVRELWSFIGPALAKKLPFLKRHKRKQQQVV